MNQFTLSFFRVKCPGEGGRFKYFENHNSYVNQFFALLIPQDVRFLFECAKYCACFSKFLPAKRLKVILLKDRKSQILNIFRCQGVPKNGLYTETVSPLQSIPAFAPQPFLSLSVILI